MSARIHWRCFNCTDINERTSNVDPCSKNQPCRNTPGSYDCVCDEILGNMDSGSQENFIFSNPGSRALEAIIQHKESGIPVTIRMRNLSATDRESGIHRVARLEIFVPILAKFSVPVSPVLFFEILRGHIASPPRAKIGQALSPCERELVLINNVLTSEIKHAFHYTGPTGPRPLGLTKGKWNACEPKVRPN